jgi:hypothetical protein
MKYLKGIFEGYDSNQEVTDFAEGCLAYLLDDGFKVNVIDFNKSDKKMIFLSKHVEDLHYGFTWDEVKDYYIPFIKMLANRYKLEFLDTEGCGYKCSINFKLSTAKNTWISPTAFFTYHQIAEDNLYTMYNNTRRIFDQSKNIFRIGVKISVNNSQSISENSKTSRLLTPAILEDFAQRCLAYLIDEGFIIMVASMPASYSPSNRRRIYVIWLSKGEKESRVGFEWDEVKDYYIPFVQLLSRRYKLFSFEIGKICPIRFMHNLTPPTLQDYTYEQITDDRKWRIETQSKKIYSIGIRIIL